MKPNQTVIAIALALVLGAACSAGDDYAGADSSVVAAGTTETPRTVNLADVAGRWNVVSVPLSGTDTTPIPSVLVATPGDTGWTLTLQNRPAVPVRVHVMGDSVMTESGPFESVLRRGVQVTTTTVYRLQGDSLVGVTTSRYANAGADSVLRLRTVGRRAAATPPPR